MNGDPLDFRGAWLPLAASLLAAFGLLGGARPARRDVAAAAGLFAAALALRLVFGLWGPFHPNGQAADWILGALREPERLAGYGPGYAELLGGLARLAGAEADRAIFAANALCGAGAAAATFVLARLLGLERGRALLAGAAAALDPFAVRYAATESYFGPMAALLSAGAALVAAGSRAAARGPARSVALLAAGAALAVECARVHPAGWAAPALLPLVAAAAAEDARAAVRTALAGALVVAVVAAIGLGGIVEARFAQHAHYAQAVRPPGRVAELVVLVLGGLALWRARPRRALLPAAGAALLLLLTREVFEGASLSRPGYDRMLLPLVLAGAAAALPAAGGLAWRAAGGGLLAVWLGLGALQVRPANTEQLEYAWLRDVLARQPPGCALAWVARAEGRAMTLPLHRVPGPATVPVDPGAPATVEAVRARTGCVLYVRTSLCAGAASRGLCDAAERALVLGPGERTTLPARAGYVFPYDADVVEVRAAPVLGVRAGAAGP